MILKSENEIIPYKHITRVTKDNYTCRNYETRCYVLIGFNSNHEENYYRVMKLKEYGISPFAMPFNKKDQYQKNFARWVNHKAIFKSVEWKNYYKGLNNGK